MYRIDLATSYSSDSTDVILRVEGRGGQKRDRFAAREHEMHEALLEPWWQ